MTTTVKARLGAGAVLVVLGAAMVAVRHWRASHRSRDGGLASTPPVTLAVEAFRVVQPKPESWASASFAESLASRLARLPGLDVQVTGRRESTADFTLRGDVTARDGRLVIATHLYQQGERAPLWTATFWRNDTPEPNLVGDLAADVAEALYGQLARRTVTTAGERR